MFPKTIKFQWMFQDFNKTIILIWQISSQFYINKLIYFVHSGNGYKNPKPNFEFQPNSTNFGSIEKMSIKREMNWITMHNGHDDEYGLIVNPQLPWLGLIQMLSDHLSLCTHTNTNTNTHTKNSNSPGWTSIFVHHRNKTRFYFISTHLAIMAKNITIDRFMMMAPCNYQIWNYHHPVFLFILLTLALSTNAKTSKTFWRKRNDTEHTTGRKKGLWHYLNGMK